MRVLQYIRTNAYNYTECDREQRGIRAEDRRRAPRLPALDYYIYIIY